MQRHLMMFPRGSMQRSRRTGPEIDPWGSHTSSHGFLRNMYANLQQSVDQRDKTSYIQFQRGPPGPRKQQSLLWFQRLSWRHKVKLSVSQLMECWGWNSLAGNKGKTTERMQIGWMETDWLALSWTKYYPPRQDRPRPLCWIWKTMVQCCSLTAITGFESLASYSGPSPT